MKPDISQDYVYPAIRKRQCSFLCFLIDKELSIVVLLERKYVLKKCHLSVSRGFPSPQDSRNGWRTSVLCEFPKAGVGMERMGDLKVTLPVEL